MTIATVEVSIVARLCTGLAMPNGTVKVQLAEMAIVTGDSGAFLPPEPVTITLDASGSASSALVPGQYTVTICDQDNVQQWTGTASVPAHNCNLHDCLNVETPAPSDAQQAVDTARHWATFTAGDVPEGSSGDRSAKSWAQEDLTPAGQNRGGSAKDWAAGNGLIDGASKSAKAYSLDSAGSANASETSRQAADGDAAQTAADRAQTGLDRQQTGSDRTQTGSDLVAANSARDASIAQASLAAGYASSAASVAQQDLSGVTAAALHRSPNAVVALAIYDTSKDNDGGAWINKVDASYLYRPLNGKWLGWAANEAGARAVSGAATGDYYGNTTDGKFYRLSAGAGQTETLDGNTAKFPRMAAVVAEAARVVVYDLLSPGRPMWMVFAGGIQTKGVISWATAANTQCVAIGQGRLWIGAVLGNNIEINFATDSFRLAHTTSWRLTGARNIADRNNTVGFVSDPSAGYVIASGAVNAVAMMVRPTSPIDPATGLQVPTIGVAVGTGNAGQVGSVLMDDGTVVNYSQPSQDGASVEFTSRGDVAWGFSNNTFIAVLPLATSNVANVIVSGRSYSSVTAPGVGSAVKKKAVSAGGTLAVSGVSGGGTVVSYIRENPSASGSSLGANITGTYNTGIMAGDVRRCVMADTGAGVASGTNKITNGTFTTDASGWTAGTNNTLIATGGQAKCTTNQANGPYFGQNMGAVTAGQVISVTFDVNSDGTSNTARGFIGSSLGTSDIFSGSPASAFGTVTFTFTVSAPASACWFWVQGSGAVSGNYILIDNVSIADSAVDRSVKAKNASIVGTLTKTAVASAAQLVAWSGWSAANYMQEAYSADLDPGTGSLFVPFVGTIPANVAAAGWAFDRSAATGAFYKMGHDATGKLTASVSDGTTTRTATTTAAYNSGMFFSAGLLYEVSGMVSILVNGQRVASTAGTPLSSLSNASATMTYGIDRGLTAPWAGSLAMVKPGMTVPSNDALAWIYAQERQMFRDGAQVTLPDTGNVLDMAYDAQEGKLKIITAANEASFVGLVRTATAPVPAGSFSKASHTSGVKLLARTTTTPGVDVTLPAQNLKEELLRRAEDAARALRAAPRTFDFDATASQTDFTLPVGWEVAEVIAARSSQREGATKDWTRKFDGFRETAGMNTGQALNTWVQVIARRSA